MRRALPVTCLGWDPMNETLDTESRKSATVKYIALAVCLAAFVAYGLVVG